MRLFRAIFNLVAFWRWSFETRVMFVWGVLLTQLGFMAIKDIHIHNGELLLILICLVVVFSTHAMGFARLNKASKLVCIEVVYWLTSIYCLGELTNEDLLRWDTIVPYWFMTIGVLMTMMTWTCFPYEEEDNGSEKS